MSADFRRLLEQADGDFVSCRFFELFQSYSCGEARGAAADDDHIIFHAVPFNRFLLARREVARRGGRALSAPTGDSGQAGMAQARRRGAEHHAGRPHAACCAQAFCF